MDCKSPPPGPRSGAHFRAPKHRLRSSRPARHHALGLFDQHLGGSGFGDIIPQADNQSAVIPLQCAWLRCEVSGHDLPTLRCLFQIDMGNGPVKGRQVQRQLATGVQREGRAVKDRLILPPTILRLISGNSVSITRATI